MKSSNPLFSFTDPAIGCLPFLANIGEMEDFNNWKILFLVSNHHIETGHIRSIYLPLINITLDYNLDNANIYNHQLSSNHSVWLISSDLKNREKIFNIDFLKRRGLFHKFVFTNNFELAVKEYYRAGIKLFILDGPSQMVRPIHYQIRQHIYQDALFICLRETSNDLRRAGSNFLFFTLDNKSMVENRLLVQNKANNNGLAVILCHSESIDVSKYRQYLRNNHIRYFDVNNLDKIPTNISIIDGCFNEKEFDLIYDYLLYHRTKFDKLRFYKIDDDYFNLDQTSDYLTSYLNLGT